jgi:hypothetical protein
MKHVILLVFIVFHSLFASAQSSDEVEKVTFHEVGINATELLAQLLKIPNDSAFYSKQNYLLTYKFYYKNYALRFGGGIDYRNNQSKRKELVEVKSQTSFRYDLRIGVEKKVQLYKRWSGYFGLDAIAGYSGNKIIVDSGFDKTTKLVDSNYFGFGPTIGLQFNLSKRLCFATETSIWYKVFQGQNKTFFEQAPQFNNIDELTSGSSVNYTFPTSLYIIYRM